MHALRLLRSGFEKPLLVFDPALLRVGDEPAPVGVCACGADTRVGSGKCCGINVPTGATNSKLSGAGDRRTRCAAFGAILKTEKQDSYILSRG